jgi:hypothetical protein
MNILPGAGGSDRGPDGTPLQFSNPADEEPDLCVWCGGNAEDGATVPVVTREEAESVHPSMKTIPAWWYGDGHGWGIRLCEACNEERKAKWEDEDFDLGLERICEHLGISAELSPMERSAAAIEKIKKLAPVSMWVNADERAPKNGVTVQVLIREHGHAFNGDLASARCWNGIWTLSGTSFTIGVSHWREIDQSLPGDFPNAGDRKEVD